jgi:hypothetical protein
MAKGKSKPLTDDGISFYYLQLGQWNYTDAGQDSLEQTRLMVWGTGVQGGREAGDIIVIRTDANGNDAGSVDNIKLTQSELKKLDQLYDEWWDGGSMLGTYNPGPDISNDGQDRYMLYGVSGNLFLHTVIEDNGASQHPSTVMGDVKAALKLNDYMMKLAEKYADGWILT